MNFTDASRLIGSVIRRMIVVIVRTRVSFALPKLVRISNLHVHALGTVYRSLGCATETTIASISKTRWTVPLSHVSVHSLPVLIKKCVYLNRTSAMEFQTVTMALMR